MDLSKQKCLTYSDSSSKLKLNICCKMITVEPFVCLVVLISLGSPLESSWRSKSIQKSNAYFLSDLSKSISSSYDNLLTSKHIDTQEQLHDHPLSWQQALY